MAGLVVKLLGIFLVVVVSASSTIGEDFHYPDHEFDKTPLGEIVDKASMKILKEAYNSAGDKNVISSPLGALTLLSLYSAGTDASGKLRQEIITALGSANYTELARQYSSLSSRFSGSSNSYITFANKIYLNDQYELNDQFKKTVTEDYRSEVVKTSFTDPSAAANTVNEWAKAVTRGHITNVLNADDLSPPITALLFNVIYFQGHWNIPFEIEDTKEKDFHISKEKTVKKLNMHLLESLFYYKSDLLGARMVELPYKEKGFRMIVVLPNEIDGLASVLDKVEEHGLVDEVFKLEPVSRHVNLNIPKFEIESGIDLGVILPKVGVKSLFTEPATSVVKDDSVVISKAFQKAFIKIDEEGATAGAFTGMVAVPMSLPMRPPVPIEFNVDRPFLFTIMHEDVVLFTGTYSH